MQTQWNGEPFGQLDLAGRARAGGPVDDVGLNAGHWPDGPGQVVLAGSAGGGGPALGSAIAVTGVPGHPELTVVGFGNSVTSTADGWVTPGEIGRLRAPGVPPSAQLLYRFSRAATQAEVRADVAEVTRALPADAVTGAASWLAAEDAAAGNGAVMEPFVIAFALIGLAMAVLIVGNVVSGAVVAAYQRIGVLKSVGLTPAQVVLAYLSRVGWPALAGGGGRGRGRERARAPGAEGVGRRVRRGQPAGAWWASAAAPAGMLVLVLLAGFGPALRAGRLSAAQAIAAGRAPAGGPRVRRAPARFRAEAAAAGSASGLAAPFARPARTAVTLAAIAFGATAVIFAFGLHASLARAAASQAHTATIAVYVEQSGPENGPADGPPPVPSAAQDAAAVAALRAQPGTRHVVAHYEQPGQGGRDRGEASTPRRSAVTRPGPGSGSSPGAGTTRRARWT